MSRRFCVITANNNKIQNCFAYQKGGLFFDDKLSVAGPFVLGLHDLLVALQYLDRVGMELVGAARRADLAALLGGGHGARIIDYARVVEHAQALGALLLVRGLAGYRKVGLVRRAHRVEAQVLAVDVVLVALAPAAVHLLHEHVVLFVTRVGYDLLVRFG